MPDTLPPQETDRRQFNRFVTETPRLDAALEGYERTPPDAHVDATSHDWQKSVNRFYDRILKRFPPGRRHYYHRRIERRLAHLIEPNKRVLDIGCGDGQLLTAVKPSLGVGVDMNAGVIEAARKAHPDLTFEHMRGENVHRLGQVFDYVIISQTLGEVYDLCTLFRAIQSVCHARTRVIVVHWSRLWQPALKIAEWLRIKRPAPEQNNWVPVDEVKHLLGMSDFETIRSFGMTPMPVNIPFVSGFINRVIGNLPLIHHLGLNQVILARSTDPRVLAASRPESVSIVVAARNESGHIRPLLERIPRLAAKQEVIFVEGGSQDDTWEEIQRVAADYHGPYTIKCLQQDGVGKGDAVRKGFAAATGDILIIHDADISVPPEELPKFYEAVASGRGEFINGSRMVYIMDRKAMRFLNLVGNKFFGWVFTYLLSQRFRDTLCGTKVLTREDYLRLAANRSYFGDFDPFGDFDVLFGAAKLNLKILDIPVHYKARIYGDTNISRFSHGWLLVKMCLLAARKLKLV